MTTLSQSTKRKLSLLQLAEELGKVSKACKLMGYHRDTFYRSAPCLPRLLAEKFRRAEFLISWRRSTAQLTINSSIEPCGR